MSRIEINQGASADQPKFKTEGEFKGKHGADGFVEKASFLARIFGYYVKIGEHYLNPKSLANYTNTKNAALGNNEPVLKPHWFDGKKANSKVEAAFLKLFPKSGAPSQTVNNPPAPLQQQPGTPRTQTPKQEVPAGQPSSVQPNGSGGMWPEKFKPGLKPQENVSLEQIEAAYKQNKNIPVIQPNSSKTTVQSFQEAQAQQPSSVLPNPFATAPATPKSTSSDQPEPSLSDQLDAALKKEGDTTPVIQPGTRSTVQPLATDKDQERELVHGLLDTINTATGGKFRETVRNDPALQQLKNATQQPISKDQERELTHGILDAFDKASGGKFREANRDMTLGSLKTGTAPFDMALIGFIYTDNELREALRASFNIPRCEEKFRNDLRAFLDIIPNHYGSQSCTAESWSKAINELNTQIADGIVNTIKNGKDDFVVTARSPELAQFGHEREAYIQELRQRNIQTRVDVENSDF